MSSDAVSGQTAGESGPGSEPGAAGSAAAVSIGTETMSEPLDASRAVQAANPDPPPRVHRLRYLLAGALLIVGGSAFAVHLYPRATAPERVVAAYFAALHAGNAALALSYARPPDGDTRYLSPAFLKAQQATGSISAVHAEAPRRLDGAIHVRVSYDVVSTTGAPAATVSRRRTDDVILHERNRRWLIDRPAASVQVVFDAAGKRASLGGYVVPAVVVDMFPGAVPVRFDDDLVTAPALDALVSLAAPRQRVHVRPQLSQQSRRVLSTAVTAAMNRCLTLAGRAAAGCPLTAAVTRAVPRTLRGSVTAVSLSKAAVTGPTGLITVSGQISVHGTYQVLDYENVATTRAGVQRVHFTAALYGRHRDVVKWTS